MTTPPFICSDALEKRLFFNPFLYSAVLYVIKFFTLPFCQQKIIPALIHSQTYALKFWISGSQQIA